jgi:hypothetical protein
MKSGKRDIQLGVKMPADDFAELKRAADVLGPAAILTNSSVILGLAKLKASDVLNPGAAPKKTKPRGWGIIGPQESVPRLPQAEDAISSSLPRDLLAHTIVPSLKLVNGTGEVKSLARAG